jgi:hypothetical protein
VRDDPQVVVLGDTNVQGIVSTLTAQRTSTTQHTSVPHIHSLTYKLIRLLSRSLRRACIATRQVCYNAECKKCCTRWGRCCSSRHSKPRSAEAESMHDVEATNLVSLDSSTSTPCTTTALISLGRPAAPVRVALG